MDWTQIIITFLSSGAFLGLFLIAEKKTKAQMANMQVMLDNYKEQCQRYSDSNKELLDENKKLHKQLDDANTLASINELKRCDCILCKDRIPPLAEAWNKKVIDRDSDIDSCHE